MGRSISVLIVCLALISCATSQPATTNAEAEVQQASDAFWAAREREDLAAFTAHFTEAGILMIPGLADTSGRTAIRNLMEERFAGGRTSDFKVTRREIQVVGDTAHELAWYSEIYHGEGDPLRMHGRYINVWKREADGVWRLHRNMYNFSGMTPVPRS